MIELWQALVLALVQGLTEFLPISSSAHLLFPTLLLGWPDQGLAFDVAVHLGTLLAVVGYFRQDLLELAAGLLDALRSRRRTAASDECVYLAIATVPAVCAGLLLDAQIDKLRALPVIAATTITFGLLLAWADRERDGPRKQAVDGPGLALLIGTFQALALVPGTSRSGITMTAGLLGGLSRSAAARFSFLLSIPVIAGAGLLKTLDLLRTPDTAQWGTLLLGTGVAAVSAYVCIRLFLALVESVGMLPFVIYRVLLGTVLLFLWWS